MGCLGSGVLVGGALLLSDEGTSLAAAIKRCPKCETDKLLDQFHCRKTGPRTGHAVAHCKECNKATRKESEKTRAPDHYRRYEWPSKLKSYYGITVDDYYRMLDEQGGCCATCGARTPGSRHYKRMGKSEYFHIDHCHASGKVRGLLCSPCNRAIGLLRDDPDIAANISTYLKRK